ncbi:MAG: hypothetical protein JSS89_13405 [Bacteroidetes bacterium]|nr:hypothetical protein [Bacteroidota bacterium]
MKRSLRTLLFGVVAVLLFASCQNATQPTDLSADRTMTLSVRSSKNEPIADATIDWTKITGPSAPIGSVTTTGADGYARFVVPNVSTVRDSVRLMVTMPPSSVYATVGPFNFTTAVCSDTTITVNFTPIVPCGTITIVDTISVDACPTTSSSGGRQCRYYPTSCAGGLVFTATDSSADAISIELASSGQTTSMVQVCASYRPASSTPSGTTETFTTAIEGRAAGTGPALVRINLVVIGRTTCDVCPCPTVPPIAYTADTVCLGTTTTITVPLDKLVAPIASSSDCETEFRLISSLPSGLALPSGSSFVVQSKQIFPPLEVDVEPVSTAPITTTLVYEIRTRKRSTGVESVCSERFNVDLFIPVITGQCAVSRFTTDTLQKCVYSDSSSQDTFSIINTGACAITVTVTPNSPYFAVQPQGTVTIPARSRKTFTVTFNATKSDWDANPAPITGARGEKYFTGPIRIDGCAPNPTFITSRGEAYVQCNAFKYQCLRQFRPPGFPNTYAESIQLIEDKTTIVYQNDNQRFQQYDVFVKSLTPNGGTFDVELASGAAGAGTFGVFRKIASGFTVDPGQSICDTYPLNATAECTSMKSDPSQGTPTLGGLRAGDVVLYVKIGSSGSVQCALIWLQSVGLDRPGANALPQVCIELCYPMFTL